IQEPGTHHRALTPTLEGAGDVLDDPGGGHDFVALGEGLHHAVLDAVVDHLDEVSGTHGPGMHETTPFVGGEALEDRPGALDLVRGTADHDAVAVLAPPHPTADPDVEVADAPTGELVGTFTVVDVVGIATLDDQVPFVEKVVQLVDGRAGLFSGGNHHPHRAGCFQAFHERNEPVDIALVGGHVVTDDLVPLLTQTCGHVAAHLAKTDHSELHGSPVSSPAVDMSPSSGPAGPPPIRGGTSIGPVLRIHPDRRTGMIRERYSGVGLSSVGSPVR